MKIFFSFLVIILFPLFSIAQSQSKDSGCLCNAIATINYPTKNADIKQGTVIIEFDVDSTCILSNPVIKQSLGDDYDKEALRAVKQYISTLNRCRAACSYKSNCKKGKLQQPISFKNSDDDP